MLRLFPWLINPKTNKALSQRPRSEEEIFAEAHTRGFDMYGPKGEGAINCVGHNHLALPGMIVRVAVGLESKIYDKDGNLKETIEPFRYYALVIGSQRGWFKGFKGDADDPAQPGSWTINKRSPCLALIVRIEPEEKRLYLDDNIWRSCERVLPDKKKERIDQIVSTELMDTEDLVALLNFHGVYGGRTGRKEYRATTGRQPGGSPDSQGTENVITLFTFCTQL